MRLSPTTIDPATGQQNFSYYMATSSDPDAVYEHAVASLNQFGLAYLLLSEPRWSGSVDHDISKDQGFVQPLSNHKYRNIFKGTLMAAGGFTLFTPNPNPNANPDTDPNTDPNTNPNTNPNPKGCAHY